MIRLEGKVIATSAGSSLIQFERDSGCGGCSGCGSAASRGEAWVAGNVGALVSATVSLPALLAILSHSLILPLAGFVAGTVLATATGAGDGTAALLSLTGLGIGLALCRRQSTNRLQIVEVPND